ncbi:NAD(P)/FAD-dependent oxidoreductase [Scytonema sp. NUACC21]
MNTSRSLNHYDLIVIGSGMGALTVASLMAQLRGKRVLVLERHFKAGGFTHSFKRKKFQWDPGIHYIGQMSEGSPIRSLFDMVTGKGVQWSKMAEPFDKFVYPDLTFDVYGDQERYTADLIQRFPKEEKGIRQYFKDISRASTAFFLHAMEQNGTPLFKVIGWLGKLWTQISLNLTTKEYLDRHFKNPQLKALLTSQWGTYGVPPSQSPFALHATIVNHYLTGGYYPVGGSGTIAESVNAIVEEHGGKILLNREVTEILIDGRKAVGVKARKVNAEGFSGFEEYYAPVVISNAGAINTYLKLIPQDYPISFRKSLRQFVQDHPPATNIALYLGLSDDPRKLGFQGENHWLYELFDHDAIYEQRFTWLKHNKPLQAYLSFPSLKDPEAKAHTAEIITFVDYDSFAQWNDRPWRHRNEDYYAFKERLSQAIIDLVNRYYPGFSNLVEYCEISTPITNEHFSNHPKGGIYGFPFGSERFQSQNQAWTQVKTPINGLYLTGVDLFMPGLVPAMMTGLLTLGHLPDGISMPQAFSTAARASTPTTSVKDAPAGLTAVH